MKIVYLASPYSSSNPQILEERHAAACAAAAQMMMGRLSVFSPIAHSHFIAKNLPVFWRDDHQFWMAQDLPLLRKSDVLAVLCLDGWKRSRGVAEEIQFAEQFNIPVFLMDPPDENGIAIAIEKIHAHASSASRTI